MNDRMAPRRSSGRNPAAEPVGADDGDFEVIRGLLDEAGPAGSSSTLENWRKNASERLARAAEESVSPARTQQILQVRQAYEVATALVEAILRQARLAESGSQPKPSR